MQQWLERIWYTPRWWDLPPLLLLAPLSLLYCLLAWLRRQGYRLGWLSSQGVAVPLVVVGNITVGGSGKSPLVIALVEWLRSRGFTPAVVSRGYGRSDESVLLRVETNSPASEVGDEPLLIAATTGVAVYVCADRVLAAAAAVAAGADIIVSDDGLQHYRMQRTLELAVVDQARQQGNRLCLPAGPLREPVTRLTQVDAVVLQGGGAAEPSFRLQVQPLYRLGQREERRSLQQFRGCRVHAVAAIGNPQRFFDQLVEGGIEVIPHPFPDHHQYNGTEFGAADGLPLLMTEKDAVKCAALPSLVAREVWVVPVVARMSPPLLQILENSFLGNSLEEVSQNGG
jgi:tetraacyldisaccharide 4'-kinase